MPVDTLITCSQNNSSFQIFGLPIDTIIAISAVIAVFVSILTLRQSKLFNKKDKLSKHAFIAPSSEAGFVDFGSGFENPQCLFFSLENYGTNPASRMKARILSYNQADIDGANKNPQPILSIERYFFNPLPKSSKWNIKISGQELDSEVLGDISLLGSNYFIIKLSYFDDILEKEYNDDFYWSVNDDNKLEEVEPVSFEQLEKFKSMV